MSLLEKWREAAYNTNGAPNADVRPNTEMWDAYLPKEQEIYEYILSEKVSKIEGSLSELANRFGMSDIEMMGFFDGIYDALPGEPSEKFDPDTITEDSFMSVNIDFERLYKKMVEYRAAHLYSLPQWSNIFDEEHQKQLYAQQKQASTIVKPKKVGRNDPCPCGSGKKYKKCCGE